MTAARPGYAQLVGAATGRGGSIGQFQWMSFCQPELPPLSTMSNGSPRQVPATPRLRACTF